MNVEEFGKIKNGHEYRYKMFTVYLLTKEIILVILSLLQDDMDDFYVSECYRDDREPVEINDASELSFENCICISGFCKTFNTDIIIFIHPNTHTIVMLAEQQFVDNFQKEDNNGKQRLLTKKEKECLFVQYFGALEIQAHNYFAANDSYTKFILAIRLFIDNNYSEEYSRFNFDDEHSINLTQVLAPPKPNHLPPS